MYSFGSVSKSKHRRNGSRLDFVGKFKSKYSKKKQQLELKKKLQEFSFLPKLRRSNYKLLKVVNGFYSCLFFINYKLKNYFLKNIFYSFFCSFFKKSKFSLKREKKIILDKKTNRCIYKYVYIVGSIKSFLWFRYYIKKVMRLIKKVPGKMKGFFKSFYFFLLAFRLLILYGFKNKKINKKLSFFFIDFFKRSMYNFYNISIFFFNYIGFFYRLKKHVVKSLLGRSVKNKKDRIFSLNSRKRFWLYNKKLYSSKNILSILIPQFLIKKGFFYKSLMVYSTLYIKALGVNYYFNKIDASNFLVLLFNFFKTKWTFVKKLVKNKKVMILKGVLDEKKKTLFALNFLKKHLQSANSKSGYNYLYVTTRKSVSVFKLGTKIIEKFAENYDDVMKENLKTQKFALSFSRVKQRSKIKW